MTINIENLTIEELIDLNGKIVNRIKDLRTQEQMKAATQFRIGDVVSCIHQDKRKIIGFVLSIRKTKITILTEDNERWSVPASVLTPEESPSKKLLKLLEEIFPKSIRVSFSTPTG